MNTGYSKASTLDFVKDKLSIFVVPKFIFFNCYLHKKEDFFEELKEKLLSFRGELIIRSSAEGEDSNSASSAGVYDSIANVPLGNKNLINESIRTVIASYKKKRQLLPNDEVIIQEMVLNSQMSGVLFTHDLNTGAPYYVVNYDDRSGRTDSVTSGLGEYANRTLYIHRNSIDKIRSDRFKILLSAVKELESVMGSQFLDIEFAFDEGLKPFLLQVRTITTKSNWNRLIAKRIDITLKGVQEFVSKRLNKINCAYGETTILGQMPDWNPVEMIGRVPRILATSIYQALITNNAWSVARKKMGYSVPTGQPLMVTMACQPFIDTRLSFHSFLPFTVSPIIAKKVVNKWLNNLKESPEFHDKVEFEIAITTFSFDIDEKIKNLIGDVLTEKEKQEFKLAHLGQTRRLLKGEGSGSIKEALLKINILNDKHKKNRMPTNVSSLFAMISECIEFGTIPFSILARHGFIAKTILVSLCNLGIITNDEVNEFQRSIETVASSLVDDISLLKLGKISNQEFMSLYGHLRPGTYDIMSQRYDQMNDLSKSSSPNKVLKKIKPFQFSQTQQDRINKLLKGNGFEEFNADNLIDYMREAIVGREYGKFVFTRSVSDILELIANFAQEIGLSRDEISHIPLDSILATVTTSSESNIEEHLRSISGVESKKHKVGISIRLPMVVTCEEDVHIVPFQVSYPNFITNKKVTASCIALKPDIDKPSLKDKIVLIEGADPGFDWIFSQKIVGLITKYGGVNSHMAIRCAEFGIPAAIGCGEQRFEMLLKSSEVSLDCAACIINPLVN
ncbi:PEP/pyruvate-binding domain-containing protein [Methylophilaceae bacterium Uisw_099_01]